MTSRLWPDDIVFEDLVLVPHQRTCDRCGAFLSICDHRFHPISTLCGPRRIVAKLVHCSNKSCPARKRTHSPEDELLLTMPGWTIGWDVFAFIGFLRFKGACCVREIREELVSRYDIVLSDDAIEDYIQRYQTMVSARWLDIDAMRACYSDTASVVLTIDGLKPDQSHETLYVVRELSKKRIWFAATLKASDQGEIDALFVKAKEIAGTLGLTVRAWMSDKQPAFVNGVKTVFSDTPHFLCRNHFLRKLAEPVTTLDKSAVATIRKKVRGLREIERKMEAIVAPSPAKENPPEQSIVMACSADRSDSLDASRTGATPLPPVDPIKDEAAQATQQELHRAQTVLDYATALRGILSDSRSGPLTAASTTMVTRLEEVNKSMKACADLKKGGLVNPLYAT